MINFPRFERIYNGRKHSNGSPSQGTLIVVGIGVLIIVIMLVVMSIGSSAGTVDIEMTEYKIENNVAIIKIKSQDYNVNELSYDVSETPMQQDVKRIVRIHSKRNDSSLSVLDEIWYPIENNTIRVPLDDITNEITIQGIKSFEKPLLVKNTTTGEWEEPSFMKKLSYSFKLF